MNRERKRERDRYTEGSVVKQGTCRGFYLGVGKISGEKIIAVYTPPPFPPLVIFLPPVGIFTLQKKNQDPSLTEWKAGFYKLYWRILLYVFCKLKFIAILTLKG